MHDFQSPFAAAERYECIRNQGILPPVTTSDTLVALCRRPKTDRDRQRAAWHLLDWLGCIAAAQDSPAAHAAARYLGLTGLGSAMSDRAEAEAAAFLTGALGNLLEMDDLHRASLLHVGDVVCPAALGAALRAPVTGAALLDAVIGGYEAAIRIGAAAAAAGYAPWYNSATCGVFGAALAAADIAGLPDDTAAAALSQAGMTAAGLWQCRLDPGTGKQLATAHAARAGVAAAAQAAAGFTGPARILEGEIGFLATYYPGSDVAAVIADPARAFQIHDVSFKPWPACRHTHPAIAAALTLPPGGVAEVTVATYRAALEFCDAPNPQTDHDARFSLQHCVAVALLRGAPTLADFQPGARADPNLAALRARVRLREDPEMTAAFPARMSARLTLRDLSGHVHTAACRDAPGDPEDPLPEAELRDKARRNLRSGGVAPEAAEALIDTCHALPLATDLAALRAALAQAFPCSHPAARTLT
jgi:2-methylcitrate dehydratase PrpD